jgi:formiminotetrahydrofolate cyclodeaminase
MPHDNVDSFGQMLDELAARTAAPGGGAAAAWTAAVAAALVEMAAAFAERPGERAAELRGRALELAKQELRAYQPVLEAKRAHDAPRVREALITAAESPLAIAAVAEEVSTLATELAATGKPSVAGDAQTAAVLADAAREAAANLAEINLSEAREIR